MFSPPVAVLLGSLLAPAAAAAQQPRTVDHLAWLQGCWEAAGADRIVEEHWMAPRAGSMVAMNRTVRGGRLTAHELVVVVERDGRLVYQAHPSGQASAEFPLATLDDSTVVFENPGHDFPQHIGYRRTADSLHAWIAGIVNGQERRADFPFRRVACPGR